MGDKQEMISANVQVAVRCRPLNSREKTAGNLHVVTTEPSQHRVRVAHKKLDRTYQYDHVFGPFASQEEVFVSTVQPIVREMLQGYSTTVFAYGQTGTGKTHTMEGDITDPDNMGVIPRSVHAIFDYLDRISADYTVRTSFLELYNEELQDLLGNSGTNKNKVVLREDTKRGVVCCGLEEVQVLSAKDIFSILSRGIQQRKTAETLMNKNSSRSHSIFTLKIMIKECMPDGQEVMRNGQLNLVDLAGSECVGRSGAKNARAREAGNINQSLLTLGRVITALVEHHPHVPYRDSKLTRLLQESLGGRAKTCIIATVTSSSDALEETISSLDYALKAKSIQNKPVANQRLSKTHLLKEYAGELESLRSMLQASRDKNGVYMEPWRFDHMESTLASQANQIAEMEEILSMRNNETKELKADRDRFQEQATELAGELEVSKGKEESLTGELSSTRRRLEGVEGELSSSRAEAADLRGKLEATRKTLKDTEWKLGATRAVVAEQSTTETSLTAEAEQTKRSLELAEDDVGGLRAKIARQEDESATKRAKVERFQESVSKAATGVSDAVARFTGEHARGCASLRDSVAAAERRARDAASKLSSAAVSAMDQANRRCKEVAAGVTQGSQTAEECLRAASASLEQALSTQGGALKEWETQMGTSLGELNRGLRNQEGSLASLSEDVKRRSEEAHREMTAFRDKCASDLGSIKSWAEERLASQARQMELNKKEALDIAASAKEQARRESEEFVKSMTALVMEMQSKATARADELTSSSESSWAGSVAATTTFGTQMSDRVNVSASHVSSGVQSMLDNFERSTSVTRDALQDNAKTASSFAASTMDVSENVTAGAARMSGLAEDATTGVKRDLDRVSASVAETSAKCRRGAESLADDATGAVASFNRLREEAEVDVQKHGAEATLQVGALGSAVAGFSGEHEGSLGACMEHIQDHVKEACASRGPSGGTPERKAYPRPDGFSVTRSHGEIMNDYGAASFVNSPPPPPPSPSESTAVSTVGGAAVRLSEEGGEGFPAEMDVGRNDEERKEQRRCRSVSVGESTRPEEGCGAASTRSSFGADTTCSEDAMSVQDEEATSGGTMVPLCEATNMTKGRAEMADDASTDGTGSVDGRGGSKIPTFRRSTRRARAA